MASKKSKEDKAKAKVQAKEEAKIKAEAEAKVKLDAEASVKADKEKAAADQEAKDNEIAEEAKTLGVTGSKIKLERSKTKEKYREKEAKKHADLAKGRLAHRVAKAKAKPLTPKQTRKLQINAMLTHWQDYPKEKVQQGRWELVQMSINQWKKGKRMPKTKKTEYEEIMDD